MIEIKLSDKSYATDVFPLVKAFYPREEIRIWGEESTAAAENKLQRETDREDSELQILNISIRFQVDRIEVDINFKNGKTETQAMDIPVEGMEKPRYKNAMRQILYRMLSKDSGKELPWGILIGIRPTKLVYRMLEDGWDEEKIYGHMKQEYLCSEDKISMSISIARRERELLREMDYRNGYSIYIGIPFCPSTCLYCSFPSYSIDRLADYVEAYLKALEKEILYAAGCFPDKKLTTVYIGGGTPTTLSAKQLDWLLGIVKKHFDFTHVKEFCVEAGRPDSITAEKLRVLKQWGVDRISINPQSMQQKTLDLIGRKHTVAQVKEAFAMARETGHDNINMDIIIGLPGENTEDVDSTLSQIKTLNPDSLTVHTLAVKRAARLNTQKQDYLGMKAWNVPSMLEATMKFARENGYYPYYLYRQKNMEDNLENIGYSRYGREGRYNMLIMEEQQTILALGAGGMTKLVLYNPYFIDRVDNVKSVMDYINRIDEMIIKKRKFFEKYKIFHSERQEG